MIIPMALYLCTEGPTLQNVTSPLASYVWGIMQSQISAHCDGGRHQDSGRQGKSSEAHPHPSKKAGA